MSLCFFRKLVVALGLTCGLCLGQQDTPDSATYATFLAQVAHYKSGSAVLLNGQETRMIRPTLQESMSLTGGETEILGKLAIAYVTRIRMLDEAVQPLLFDARLRLIDTAEPEPSKVRLRQRLNEIENRRNQILRASIDELRTQLGELRFEVVHLYVASRKNADFFPPSPSRPAPPR